MDIQFWGAAGTVTGSKTLLTTKHARVLVDCGLFQGLKELRLRNRAPFPFDPSQIDRVLLTHAHLDHSGALPLLLRQGFSGRIYCTAPTKELLRILFLDFAHLEEEDAKLANRLGFSRHHPALPLYEQADVVRTLRQVEVLSEGEWHEFGQGLKVRLLENGHILGSVCAEFAAEGRHLLFSGDLGRPQPLLLRPPKPLPPVDALVLESTYGDRLHESQPPDEVLAAVVRRTCERGGRVLVPSFAVGRAQDLLYLLAQLRGKGWLPKVPVYLDSPMAIEVSEVLWRHRDWLRVEEKELRSVLSHVKLVRDARESEALRASGEPAIVIAGSGMIAGGRILSHLQEGLSDPRHTVLLVGFQAPGTRGRLLEEGATELKMRGAYVPVRAEVARIGSLSAHADQAELLEWVARGGHRPQVYLMHGEPQAADALRIRLQDKQGLKAEIASPGMSRSL